MSIYTTLVDAKVITVTRVRAQLQETETGPVREVDLYHGQEGVLLACADVERPEIETDIESGVLRLCREHSSIDTYKRASDSQGTSSAKRASSIARSV
ncbi:hypothetical protein [Caballeronia sp. LZ001]|uniref:hypothetical protein n=1 Tax=Caballeronia sp. LZ001 TaxID=3038553 RepID=UPI0028583978|nr:hypothetical protein [Caballeronia sp. LZ001]MDR5805257.1 hypothetical protein [Caballeronia sp. LZ001]